MAPKVQRRSRKLELKIVYGEKQKLVLVHKDVICSSSPFFKIMLRGRWIEASTNTVTLPEVDEETFTAYVDWLYGEDTNFCSWKSPTELVYHAKTLRFDLGFKMYILGEFLQDFRFCTMIFKVFALRMHCTEAMPSLKLMTEFWPSLQEDCGLRRLLVDMVAVHITSTASSQHKIFQSTFNCQVWLEFRDRGKYALYDSGSGRDYRRKNEPDSPLEIRHCGRLLILGGCKIREVDV